MRIPFSRWRRADEVRRGLYWSMLDGATFAALLVCLETWMVPLLQQRLGAAIFVIGLVSLVPQLGFIVLSPFTGNLVDWLGGPKRAAVRAIWFQVPLLILLNVPLHAPGAAWAAPLTVTLLCLIGLTGVVVGPAWYAWMGALLPPQVSGRYQANRMRLFNVIKLLSAGLFAVLMRELPVESGPWGLQIVLLIGLLSRLLSLACLIRQPFPAQRPGPRNQPLSRRSAEAATGLWGFLRTLHRTDIGRWTLTWAVSQGGCAVAGPFFASYMIATADQGGLALTPFFYTVLIYTSAVSRIVFYSLVGRLVDLWGPRAMLRASLGIVCIIPATWALTGDLRLLIINEVFSGIAWAAAECSIGALLFACHGDPARRVELAGYFSTVSAALVAAGFALGTALIEVIPPLGGSRFHSIFLLSMLLRLPGVLLALRWLPSLRPLSHTERENLWDTLPGASTVGSLGRGLVGIFRRPQE